ncbi:glycosyltransferase family 2 protein [Vibrio sp.]|nr:glycosyltransferase family 2 protein [Vibrio sp.]
MQISVIIPAYNANHSLPDTIHSITNSTSRPDLNYEIIVVDDGSKNPIKSVLEEQFKSKMDSNVIRYIYQENQGVSVARNTGLTHASGDYITFCDADDLVSGTYLDDLADLANQNPSADILEFRLQTYRGTPSNILGVNQVSISEVGLHESSVALNNACQSFMWLVMCRLVKASLAKSVQFPVGIKYCEDLVYLFNLYEKASWIYTSDKILYHYQITDVSAISKVKLEDCIYVDEFIKHKSIKDKKTFLCVKAHLYYMFHSAAKRNLPFMEFAKVINSKKLGLFDWYLVHKSGVVAKRKVKVGIAPYLYYLVYKLKHS